MAPRSLSVGSAGLAVVLIVGCGGQDSSSSEARATYAPNGESLTVQALDNSFRPVEYEVSAGTEVTFENRGRNDHNILPDAVANDAELAAFLAEGDPNAWGVASTDFVPGDSYVHVFITPGTYSYYCSIHGSPGAGMYGTLVVVEPEGN